MNTPKDLVWIWLVWIQRFIWNCFRPTASPGWEFDQTRTLLIGRAWGGLYFGYTVMPRSNSILPRFGASISPCGPLPGSIWINIIFNIMIWAVCNNFREPRNQTHRFTDVDAVIRFPMHLVSAGVIADLFQRNKSASVIVPPEQSR